MKRVLVGIVIALAGVLVYRSCTDSQEDKRILRENSMLIQQEIKNVSKLIVTEGHFAEVYNYADSKELFGPLLIAHKKALVVVNADVTVAYDLSQLDVKLDSLSQTVYINAIPEPEIDINPDLEYYDVTADYLNPFKAEDYNVIKKNVRTSLLKKVNASNLRSNAQNRLLTELSRFYLLTDKLGWKLVYAGKPVNSLEELHLPD